MVEMALSSLILAGTASERIVIGAFKTGAALTTTWTMARRAASARTEACARPEAAKRSAPVEAKPRAAALVSARAARLAASAGAPPGADSCAHGAGCGKERAGPLGAPRLDDSARQPREGGFERRRRTRWSLGRTRRREGRGKRLSGPGIADRGRAGGDSRRLRRCALRARPKAAKSRHRLRAGEGRNRPEAGPAQSGKGQSA